MTMERTQVLVIGSGIGGLCCAALAARAGHDVLVLEQHRQPGGAAHGFERAGYRFESGPSLWSGLSRWPSTNPLTQILRALDLVGNLDEVVPKTSAEKPRKRASSVRRRPPEGEVWH